MATLYGCFPLLRSSTPHLRHPRGQGQAPRAAHLSARSPAVGSVLSGATSSHSAPGTSLSQMAVLPVWTRAAFRETCLPDGGKRMPMTLLPAPLLLSTPALTDPCPPTSPEEQHCFGGAVGAQAVPGLCHKMAANSLLFERKAATTDENPQKQLRALHLPFRWDVLDGSCPCGRHAGAAGPGVNMALHTGQPTSGLRPALSGAVALTLRDRGTKVQKRNWIWKKRKQENKEPLQSLCFLPPHSPASGSRNLRQVTSWSGPCLCHRRSPHLFRDGPREPAFILLPFSFWKWISRLSICKMGTTPSSLCW